MPSDAANSHESFGELMRSFRRAMAVHDLEGADAVAEDILALAEERCAENCSPDFELTMTAARFEEQGDWHAAESVYNKILALPDLEPASEYRACSYLARLYRLLQRDLDALCQSRRATAAARRADFSILLSMALQQEARCLMVCGQLAEACSALAEALDTIDDDAMFNQMRASILTLRAECAVRNNTIAEAEHDLERAYGLLEPLAGLDIAAGIHGDLSRWWSVAARVCSVRNDQEGALAAWRMAVDISTHVASLPHVEIIHAKCALADMLMGLADALRRFGHTCEAAAAFDERSKILQSIGVRNMDAE